jgi:hypothetical protein
MPDLPKGSFYLGDRLNPSDHKRAGAPVMLEAANLTTHGVIVGMTGSGKTGLGVCLLEEALLSGVPALIIDPKGDLGNLLLTFPDLLPGDFEPWINPSEVQRSGKTASEYAADVAATWKNGLAGWDIDGSRIRALKDAADFTIYTPGSSNGVPLNVVGDLRAPAAGGDAELLQDEVEGLVASLLGLLGIESDPLSGREHILLTNLVAKAWGEGRSVDLAALVAQVQNPPMRKLGVIDLETFYPAADRMGLALKLNGLLASPAFASWGEGAPLDIDALLHGEGGRPQAAIIELAHLSDQERQFVVTLILSKVVTWFRRQSGTPDLRALIYMDEVFGFVPPSAMPPAKKPILTIFKQARAFGVGMVLATQNPVDMDYKAISNAGTWMIGRLQTERDKARLMEGLTAAAGTTDVQALSDTISGLAKREFLLHSTKSDTPTMFTTRWAMSYLPGPLSREQIATLTKDSPRRALAAAATDADGTTGSGSGTTGAPAPAVLADDESTVAPDVAAGTRVVYLDPAAGWAEQIGATSTGRRLQAGVVARCQLLFDDEKADVREQQEWEAVWFPLDGALAPEQAVPVDYDDRDLRDTPPEGAVWVLPSAPVKNKAFFAKAKQDLQDHLYRSRTVEVFANRELKLFSRPGESRDDFFARCTTAADERTDADADKIRESLAAKADRIRDAIAKAEDRVREYEADKKRKGLDAIISVGGGLLGSLLGGKSKTKSILGSLGRATSKGGMTKQAGERLETAQNRLEEGQAELAELESELAEELQRIADAWDRKAEAIETLEIPLEKTDVRVDELSLVWVPTE